jgi:hypothetical protein
LLLTDKDETGPRSVTSRLDVDDVDAAYALALATGLLRDCDKCQAYIADVHSAFRSGS